MRKLMLLAAMLAMMLVAAVPALAQDASTGDVDNSVNDEIFVVAGDWSQVALNDSSQSLDQTVFQYNNPQATISGDDNQVAQGGNGVSAEQSQYSVNVLFGGLLFW